MAVTQRSTPIPQSKGLSLPTHPPSCSGTGFSLPPALTSAEHQAQRGLTARHCLQELTPRVVQMLPPETAKQRVVTICRAQNLHVH